MKIVICGGGISGLSAAYYASQLLARTSTQKCKIIVVEKDKKVGGWMKTNVQSADRSVYDGPINEFGPRSVRFAGVVGNNTLQLVSDLKMEDEVLPVTNSHVAAKKRLIYVKKQLHVLPNSLLSACTKKTPFSAPLARFIGPGLFKRVPPSYESMHEIASARFGEEVADYLIDPFTRGVFAADARKLSMKAAFPQMWPRLGPRKAAKPRRPLLPNREIFNKTLTANPFVKKAKRERWTQWTMKQGLANFNEAFAKHLEDSLGVEFLRNSEIHQITNHPNGKLSLQLKTQGNKEAPSAIHNVDHLISAIPSYALSSILRRTNGGPSKQEYPLVMLGQMLNHIQWVDVAVVNVEYDGPAKENLPQLGFGHLVPSVEDSNVLGIIYDSCAFPQHDRLDKPSTRLTCMMGGSWFRNLFGDPRQVTTATLEQSALESIAEQLKITKDPSHLQVNVHRQCIPTYQVGHTDLVENCEDLISEHNLPISLVGASYWGVSINDCIFNSRIAATKIISGQGL
uniref:Protoporphyrinogen oxidase n=1 Tax=Phallusia mammillata TaxID=59560 RepID=A0A6F9DNT1_9ASCI|nr:protoporphyrinogen oxidase-like [Phallusia mammillata]